MSEKKLEWSGELSETSSEITAKSNESDAEYVITNSVGGYLIGYRSGGGFAQFPFSYSTLPEAKEWCQKFEKKIENHPALGVK